MIRYLPVILLVALGFLLFLVGLLFRLMHWPDIFYGAYSGPALMLIAVIVFFIIYTKKRK